LNTWLWLAAAVAAVILVAAVVQVGLELHRVLLFPQVLQSLLL
jgi:hypothetical protein